MIHLMRNWYKTLFLEKKSKTELVRKETDLRGETSFPPFWSTSSYIKEDLLFIIMTVPTRTILPPILTTAAIIAASSGRHHHCNAFTTRGHGIFSHGKVVLLPPPTTLSQLTRTYATSSTNMNAAVPPTTVGNLHGQGSCFLPLLQNDEDYIAPRIVQVRSNSIWLFFYMACFGPLDSSLCALGA